MTIHLYAEHLVHIRAITIHASLPTCTDEDTKATLSADGATLTLAHHGECASIKLPVATTTTTTLALPSAPARNISFRIQLQHDYNRDQEQPNPRPPLDHTEQNCNTIPWSAPSLNPDVQIACRYCDTPVLPRANVRVWKDLPSENWAEMMDFWHCHRPHVPPNEDHSTSNKGYSAGSTLALQSGVGMVDPVDFVLAVEDCANLETIPSDANVEYVQCQTCKATLGRIHSSGGCNLRKTHLAVSTAHDRAPRSHAPEKWWACLFLSSIESQGVRKFRVHSPHSPDNVLKVWIFSPDLNVSASRYSSRDGFRAMKVFWREVEAPSEQDVGTLNRQTLAEGDIEMLPDDLRSLCEHLRESASLLPESARVFQGWNVALLPRFTLADE